jgi:hypothetical protein
MLPAHAMLHPRPDVIMLQTADGGAYADMLAVGRRANEAYARKHSLAYKCFIGIKRGYFPWHAVFNRIFLIRELILANFRGWVFYVDADAYVHYMDFDLLRYLNRHIDKAMIAGPGGLGGEPWDINDGVFLINLDHADARRLIEDWYDDFMSTSDEDLRNAPRWQDVPSDQPRLHRILRDNEQYLQGLHIAERHFFNDRKARFVRHALRGCNHSTLERLALMEADLASAESTTGRAVLKMQSWYWSWFRPR